MPVRADTLFEVIFPRILDAKKGLRGQIDATVMFTVVGVNGGVWTLDLRRGGDGKVHTGAIEDPNLNIVLKDAFLDAFLRGDYDFAAAVEAGSLGIIGSQEAYLQFTSFLLATGTQEKPKAGKLKEPKKKGISVRGRR